MEVPRDKESAGCALFEVYLDSTDSTGNSNMVSTLGPIGARRVMASTRLRRCRSLRSPYLINDPTRDKDEYLSAKTAQAPCNLPVVLPVLA